MARYLLTLLIYIPFQLLAYLITPILPLFAVKRYGALDNASTYGMALRLPTWLSWLDTPDNSLGRDGNYLAAHGDTYLSRVGGLLRNSLYGWKWSAISMPIQHTRTVTGNPLINHHTKTYGYLKIKQENGAWQYKLVKPFLGRVLILNTGWLLDDMSQEKALWMLSPRWKKV